MKKKIASIIASYLSNYYVYVIDFPNCKHNPKEESKYYLNSNGYKISEIEYNAYENIFLELNNLLDKCNKHICES